MYINKRRIMAAEEIDEVEEKVSEVDIAPEATDMLFEAEDVAELIAEVTDKVVEVEVADDDVIFRVGENEFVITPDGGEELVETSTRVKKSTRKASCNSRTKNQLRNKKPVKANTRNPRRVIRKAR